MAKRKLGEVLRERGKISDEQLSAAISDQPRKLVRLGELLLERGLVDKADISSALEVVTHVPYLDCALVVPSPEALRSLPQAEAERCCALPVELKGQRLTVIMADPQNLSLLDDLSFTAGVRIDPRQGFQREILAAIAKHYGRPTKEAAPAEAETAAAPATGSSEAQAQGPAPEMEFFSVSSRQATKEAIQDVQEELMHKRTPAVRVVSEIIQAAIARQASDIHIEPQEGDTVVRLRVDGVMRDLRRVPRMLQTSLVSRIKILSDMDIAERRAPQDGRFMVSVRGHELDMRVSTLPTQNGEKVVMRLLDSKGGTASFGQLGLPGAIEREWTRLLGLPQGMLLVTGPTGSGKSTTLYASLQELRKPTVNIVTVEDPVEYVLAGINQVHVNARAGLTFASCLRSILRQDPNVIMVGEIRDRETAEIAMKAAQTGHLVLSTLHTNDSLSAIIRLLDLEIPPYLIAASLSGIMAQRLVRKLCMCHSETAPSAEYRTRIAELGIAEPMKTEYVPGSCEICDHTGYKGRVGIYELLALDEAVRAAVRDGCNLQTVRQAAVARGLKLMQEDALQKVRAGVTTLDEVLRVVPFETIGPAEECAACGRNLAPTFRFCPYCGVARNGPHGSGAGAEKATPPFAEPVVAGKAIR